MNLIIKQVLETKGVKVSSLAESVGITRANMSNIVNGKSMPSLETLERIASALEVNVTRLFTQHENNVYGFIHANGVTHTVNSLNELERLIYDLQKQNPE